MGRNKGRLMPSPNHRIHVFQRPAQGSSFIKNYLTYNYQHTISAQGWFDTASCDIAVHSQAEGQQILEQYLGCFVQIFVDNPKVPIWEGLINRLTFNNGGASYTISLDEMANRVSCIFTGATNTAGQTTIADNTNSQGIFGIKQDQIEFGVDTTAGVATQRAKLRDTLLAERAFPQSSFGQAQGNSSLVHMELLGIFHTLEWEKQFTVVTTGNNPATAKINATLAALANGATFFNNADTSQVATNAVTIPDQQRGMSTWELLQKIAESGDAIQYWICGINPTDPNTKTRSFYYRAGDVTITYTARQADNLRPCSLYGKIISPWNVVPDNGIRVTDLLVGYGGTIRTSPREAYIQSVQYDANSQTVQWFCADNTTARAAFMLNRGFRPSGRAFGAPLRTIAT